MTRGGDRVEWEGERGIGTASEKGRGRDETRLLIHEPERQETPPLLTLPPIGYCTLLDRATAISSY